MINVDKAKWALSLEEQYAIRWFAENGFEGEIVKQYVSKTKFAVCKDALNDDFELPQGLKGMNVKAYMEQYRKQFALKQKLAMAQKPSAYDEKGKVYE